MTDATETTTPLPPADAAAPTCLHCRVNRFQGVRGLCRSCYANPDIRSAYPAERDFKRRGVGADTLKVQPLGPPTDALPGSEEKICVLEQRALLAQPLFHPLDPFEETGRRSGEVRVAKLHIGA